MLTTQRKSSYSPAVVVYCLNVMKKLFRPHDENIMCPGTDCLPTEFNKMFWIDVNPYLTNALNNWPTVSVSKNRSDLPHTQKEQTYRPIGELEANHPVQLCRLQDSHEKYCFSD